MKKRELLGALLAVAGLLVGIFGVSPKTWLDNFADWQSFIPSFIVVFCSVVLTTFVCRRIFSPQSCVRIISDEVYANEFRTSFESGKYAVVKVFGYTGEVVDNDLFKYKDRYCQHVEIRMLHRNWLVEQEDEKKHNIDAEKLGIRLWQKSAAIRENAFKEWPELAAKKKIRHYKHQPILRGVIFCDETVKPIIAFVNFMKWDPMPVKGGSEFKSVPSCVVVFESSRQNHTDFLERLNSQFEYEWEHGTTKEELTTL